MGGAAALHDPAGRIDLVSAVDRDVEVVQPVEGLDSEAEAARCLLGGDRSCNAAELETAGGERR